MCVHLTRSIFQHLTCENYFAWLAQIRPIKPHFHKFKLGFMNGRRFKDILGWPLRVGKEHAVRRELYTMPGETFSRDAIQESMRRLSQLR